MVSKSNRAARGSVQCDNTTVLKGIVQGVGFRPFV